MLDGTLTTLIPPRVKEEYATLQEDSIDPKKRDSSQVYCTKEQIAQGPAGGCQEYLSFDYFASAEVVVTLRSYKKLTTMLGEYGGLLKIMTTLVFFFYGVYSMNKVKSVLKEIIFKNDQNQEKDLKRLIGGQKTTVGKNNENKKLAKNSFTSSNAKIKIEEVENENQRSAATRVSNSFEPSGNGDLPGYEEVMKRFVQRRTNVDNLMQKLNFLELLEKAVLKDYDRTLLPLVLLKAEREEMIEERSQAIEAKTIKNEAPMPPRRKINTILSKNHQNSQNSIHAYKDAFDQLVSSLPTSQLGKDIKEYMVSQLESSFREEAQPMAQIDPNFSEAKIHPGNYKNSWQKGLIFEKNNKINLQAVYEEMNDYEGFDTPKTLLESYKSGRQAQSHRKSTLGSQFKLKKRLGLNLKKGSSKRIIMKKKPSYGQGEQKNISEFAKQNSLPKSANSNLKSVPGSTQQEANLTDQIDPNQSEGRE